jgi:transposase
MAEGSWVGLDVHARTTLAGVLDAASGELRLQQVSPRSEEAVAWLQSLPRPVKVAYEAGPTGYGLARACATAGIACTVAAPSKIPRAPGDRVKTDRRDAERLARLLRLGELVSVRVPSPEEEAARDLVRAREDARGDLMRARHRLSKLLLRHGLVYQASAWTLAHDAWLRRHRFQSRPLSLAFDECYGAVVLAKGRRDALDRAIAELAGEAPFTDVVGRLVCLRGVSTLTALALTVELGDWVRFRPQSLGPFLGLVPREDSSGERRRQGAITKTGNTHARRLLVEAAWHQRRLVRASAALERRRLGQPRAHRRRREERSAAQLRAAASATLDPRERLRSPSHTRSCGPDPRISAVTRRRRLLVRSPRRRKRPATSGPPMRAHLTILTPYQLWDPQTCETRLIGGRPPSELCGRCWLYQRR